MEIISKNSKNNLKYFIMSKLDINKVREELGLNHRELAEQLGVDRRTIINYEQGRLIPESKVRLIELLLLAKRNESISLPLNFTENDCKEKTENLNREIVELKDHIKTLKEFIEDKTTMVVHYKSENILLKQRIDELERNVGG